MVNEVSNATGRSLEKIALLNEVGRVVISSTNLDRMFEDVARLLRRSLDVQYVMIGTIEYEKGQIITRATEGLEPGLAAQHQSQGIEQGIIKNGPKRPDDHHRRCLEGSGIAIDINPGTRSEMCVPLKVFGKVAGFLNIENDRLEASNRPMSKSSKPRPTFWARP